jgi:hypothetical protein
VVAMKKSEHETMQTQIDELRASLASLDSNMVVVVDLLVAGVAANRLVLAQLVARNLAITPGVGSSDARSHLTTIYQACIGPVNIAVAENGGELQKLCKITAGKIDEFFAEVVAAAELINAATDADSATSKH